MVGEEEECVKGSARSWAEESSERRVVTETKGGEMRMLLGSKSRVGMGWDGEKEEKRAGVCGWAGETDVLSLGRSHLHKEHLSFPRGQSRSV